LRKFEVTSRHIVIDPDDRLTVIEVKEVEEDYLRRIGDDSPVTVEEIGVVVKEINA